MVAEFDGATGRADALGGECILHRDRNACERADRFAASARRVNGGGLLSGPFWLDRDHGVDVAIESLDPIEVGLEKF